MIWEERYSSALRDAESGGGGEQWLDERALFLGASRSRGHALVAPALEKWVAEKLAEESGILKERRKGREERQLARSGADSSGTGGHPPTPKQKARGGAK